MSSYALSIRLGETLEQVLLFGLGHAETVVGDGTMENYLACVIGRVCKQVDTYLSVFRCELSTLSDWTASTARYTDLDGVADKV